MGSLDGEHVSLKASLDDQSGLVEMDPKNFAPSALHLAARVALTIDL